MEQVPAPRSTRTRERLEPENWVLDAKVIERVELDETIRDVRVVEQLDLEEIVDAAEVVVDVITSPLNPLTWVKLLLKGWRALKARRKRQRQSSK